MENNQNKILGIFNNKNQLYIAIAAIAVVLVAAIIIVAVAVGGNKGGNETGNEGGSSEVGGNGNNDNTDEGNNDETNTDEGNNDETNTDEGNNDETNTDEGNNDEGNTENNTGASYTSSLELLQAILNGYNATATEETMLYVVGGNNFNFETVSFDGPAAFIPTADTDYEHHLSLPASFASKVLSAASMYNMMNVNTFNCGAFQFANAEDAAAAAAAIEGHVTTRSWECGIPEKFAVITTPDNYVVIVWGVASFGGIVEPVINSIPTVVSGATIAASGDITRG